MGTYTDLKVAGYSVLSTKGDVAPEAMTIFRETDRREYKRSFETGCPLDLTDLSDLDPDDIEDAIEYACTVGNVIDRLNVMGFTLVRAEREFEQGKKSELVSLQSWLETEFLRESSASRIEFLQSLTFAKYMEGLENVVSKKIYFYGTDSKPRGGLPPLIEYIVGGGSNHEFGFFAQDYRTLIRVFCEVSPRDQFVIQDITQLVGAGYYERGAEICNKVTEALIAGHPENSKQIVLTEGSTDASILRRALHLLYPHLADYYSFLDFELSKSPGGAGHLVSLVKAFAATGITNRVIALFDNDTAARDALRALTNINLPRNIAVRSYPDLALLRNYPTIGPSGELSLDVNGLAASIELYLGVDILKLPSGSLMPVQWKGYNETLGQYQGEVMRKTQLQHAFDQKVGIPGSLGTSATSADWTGLSAILAVVFTAFADEA